MLFQLVVAVHLRHDTTVAAAHAEPLHLRQMAERAQVQLPAVPAMPMPMLIISEERSAVVIDGTAKEKDSTVVEHGRMVATCRGKRLGKAALELPFERGYAK